MDNIHIIVVNKEGWGYAPNTSLDWDDPVARPAFYSDGKELPNAWSGEAKLLHQAFINNKWETAKLSDWPDYEEFKKYWEGRADTRQVYVAINYEAKQYAHNSLGEVLGFTTKSHTDVEALAEREPYEPTDIAKQLAPYVNPYTYHCQQEIGWRLY